jgi:glycosyltransferase involved in cell wall biosynthesis
LAARQKLWAGQQLTEQERAAAGDEPQVIRVLFLAHCTREKGLFDAVQGVLLASQHLQEQRAPVNLKLVVAGSFQNSVERDEFERLRAGAPGVVQPVGFLQGPEKERAMLEADLYCFPSHWDNQPVSVIESLAFGLPPVISRLPSVQEMLPAGYPGVVDLKSPVQMASALLELAAFGDFAGLRQHFEAQFTLRNYFANLSAALQRLEAGRVPLAPMAGSRAGMAR